MTFAYYSKFDATNVRASTPYNPNKFQIISPGVDGTYGTGGLFVPGKASCFSGAARDPERDNLTNFHSGRLGG